MIFPEDFTLEPHKVVANANQWLLKQDDKVIISIVGGGIGLYGNGVTTFEMLDFREEEPRGYLTIDEINEHLRDNPIN